VDIEKGRSRPVLIGQTLQRVLKAAGVEFPEDEPPRLNQHKRR
jgi:hypothetical protein